MQTITLTPEDENWLKTLDGGKYRKADLAAHDMAMRMETKKRLVRKLSTKSMEGKPMKYNWHSANAQQKNNLLRRANMTFEDFVAESAGREWSDTDGKSIKVGQHPYADIKRLHDMWCSSVDHCRNELKMELPDPVLESYDNLTTTRKKMGFRPYAESLVKSYSDFIGSRVRQMAGMKKSLVEKTRSDKGGTHNYPATRRKPVHTAGEEGWQRAKRLVGASANEEFERDVSEDYKWEYAREYRGLNKPKRRDVFNVYSNESPQLSRTQEVVRREAREAAKRDREANTRYTVSRAIVPDPSFETVMRRDHRPSEKVIYQHWSSKKNNWGNIRDADLFDTRDEAKTVKPGFVTGYGRKGFRVGDAEVKDYVLPMRRLSKDPYAFTEKSMTVKHGVHNQLSHGRTFFGHARGMWKPGRNETEVIIPIENPAHWAMMRANELESKGYSKKDDLVFDGERGYRLTTRTNEHGIPEQVVTSWGKRDGLERYQQTLRYVEPTDMQKMVGDPNYNDWMAFNEKSLAKAWGAVRGAANRFFKRDERGRFSRTGRTWHSSGTLESLKELRDDVDTWKYITDPASPEYKEVLRQYRPELYEGNNYNAFIQINPNIMVAVEDYGRVKNPRTQQIYPYREYAPSPDAAERIARMHMLTTGQGSRSASNRYPKPVSEDDISQIERRYAETNAEEAREGAEKNPRAAGNLIGLAARARKSRR